jgi:hypothetical protein
MHHQVVFLKWRLTKYAMQNERIAEFVTKRAHARHLADACCFGILKACASPKDSADLARGTAWVLRNSQGEAIQKVVLAPLLKAGEEEVPPDKVLWERFVPTIPDEILIALRGQAQRTGKHLSHYLQEATA